MNDITQVLDEIEREARRRYASPTDCADAADRVPALVKALRRATKQLDNIPGHNAAWGSTRKCLAEITAILTQK